jgi:hypothetical protein
LNIGDFTTTATIGAGDEVVDALPSSPSGSAPTDLITDVQGSSIELTMVDAYEFAIDGGGVGLIFSGLDWVGDPAVGITDVTVSTSDVDFFGTVSHVDDEVEVFLDITDFQSGGVLNLDLSTNQVEQIPAPGTVALFGVGMAMLGLGVCRRQRESRAFGRTQLERRVSSGNYNVERRRACRNDSVRPSS